MKPDVDLFIKRSLLTDERSEHQVSSRLTLTEMIEAFAADLPPNMIVVSINDGEPIPPVRTFRDGTMYSPWDVTRPKPGARVFIRLKAPEGSQGAQLGVGAGLFALGTALLFVPGAQGIGIGLMFSGAGMVAGGLLTPPESKSNSPTSQSTSYQLTGTQNTLAQVGQLVPWVAGRWSKMFPLHVAQPYTSWEGTTQFMHVLLSPGLGAVQIRNLMVGDIGFDSINDLEYEVREGWDTDTPPSLYPNIVYEALGEPHGQPLAISHSDGASSATIASAVVTKLTFELTFPNGIYRYSENGKRHPSSVQVKLEYRAIPSATWIMAANPTISKETTHTHRYIKAVTVNANAQGYEGRVTRATRDDSGDGSGKSTNNFFWTSFRGTSHVAPVNTKGHALIACKIPATQGNQGVLNRVSCDVTRYALDWNGSQWAEMPTANPAAIFRVIMQHLRANRGEVFPDSKIDLAGLQAWRTRSAIAGRTFSSIFADETSMLDRLRAVASSARASFSQIDGKIGVMEDIPQTRYAGAIGPHNSNNFVKHSSYRRLPHAVRVSFYDQTHDMTRQEIIAYADGYNETGSGGKAVAQVFEELNLTERGISVPARAWEEGRFTLAETLYRRWTTTQEMDLEGLSARRGEMVSHMHPAALLGIADGRLAAVSISGSNAVGVTLQSPITMEAGGITYGIRIRCVRTDGTTQLVEVGVGLNIGLRSQLNFSSPISQSTYPIRAGDYYQFGETSKVAVDCVVKSITPTGPRTVSVELTPHAHPEMEHAITGTMDPYDPRTTLPQGQPKPPPTPSIVAIRRGDLIQPGNPYPVRMVELTAVISSPPATATPASFFDAHFRVQNTTDWFAAGASVAGLDVSFLVPWGNIYEIQVRAGATSNGIPLTSNWSRSAFVDCKTVPRTIVDIARVTGLELFNQGLRTDFTGRDPHFIWRMTGSTGAAEIGDEDNAGDSTFMDPTFAYWSIKIYSGNSNLNLRREETTTQPDYVYSYEKNYADAVALSEFFPMTKIARQITIEVRIVDTFGRQSLVPARLTVQNPAPPQLLALSITTNIGTIWVSCDAPSDPDWVGIKVWASTVSGFTPDDAVNLLGKVNVNTASFNEFAADHTPVLSATTYYVRVAGYDAFGDDPNVLNVSAEFEVQTTSIDLTDIPEFTFDPPPDYTVTLGPPNSLSWTASGVHVTHPASGITNTRSISAGSVTWSGSTLYISYQDLATALVASPDPTFYTTVDRTLMATWSNGGAADGGKVTANNGQAQIDGSRIYAQTITGNALAVGVAIITQQAQIAAEVVTNAQIRDLDAKKILAGSIVTQILYVGHGSGGRITIDGTFPAINVWDDQVAPQLRMSMGKLGPNVTDWGMSLWDANGTNLLDFEGGINGSYIKDLTVDTLKIKNGALSNAWVSRQSSGFDISDTSDHNVAPVTVVVRDSTPAGNPAFVYINYQIRLKFTAAANASVDVKIKRNGTAIETIETEAGTIGGGATGKWTHHTYIDDSPNAGTATYSLGVNTKGQDVHVDRGMLFLQQIVK